MVMEMSSLTEVMVMSDSGGDSDGGECCFFNLTTQKATIMFENHLKYK